MGGYISFPFQKDSSSRVKEIDKAIASLKLMRDEIRRFRNKLQNQIDIAKENVQHCIRNKNKRLALLNLRRQKYIESGLKQAESSLYNIEQTISGIESSQIQAEVYKSLKSGNDVLKNFRNEICISQVEKLMEETEDAIIYQSKINDALSSKGILERDEDLLDELENLSCEIEATDELPIVRNIRRNEEEISLPSKKICLTNC
ncbi:unnamed protein product [Blepharisma stoltei]|uniref:Uncharacterized protein n=1 Tax=Blepharisma stoltei TaxID=1481888 RepID=A0AAU9JFT4_9CILI|nr:unnamed protein product [Blepharisma stoltei]